MREKDSNGYMKRKVFLTFGQEKFLYQGFEELHIEKRRCYYASVASEQQTNE